jgi:hypothetical protein
MTESTRTRNTPLWAKLLLILGGVGLAILLMSLVFRLFPSLIKGNAPYERAMASTTIEVDYRPSNGELFIQLPGRIRPPKDDSVLEHYTIAWDSDGFRVPKVQADHYPIAAFGDSFTEGYNVPNPWPDELASILNVPVRNYGYRGYGPLEEKQAVHDFATKEPRKWLLLAYFSGNDLSDINRTTALGERSPFLQLADQAAKKLSTEVASNKSDHYDFPMPVIIGGNYYEMAFLTYYLWGQVAPPEGFLGSQNFKALSQSLDDIAASVPADTCKAVIFIPTKEQLYYPYVYASERQWLRQNAYAPYIDASGRLQIKPQSITEAEEPAMIAHFSDQRDAVRQLVEGKSAWHFIDLLPALQKQVNAGALLYYPYDTHWNQAGHLLAAQTIAAAMQNTPGCPLI